MLGTCLLCMKLNNNRFQGMNWLHSIFLQCKRRAWSETLKNQMNDYDPSQSKCCFSRSNRFNWIPHQKITQFYLDLVITNFWSNTLKAANSKQRNKDDYENKMLMIFVEKIRKKIAKFDSIFAADINHNKDIFFCFIHLTFFRNTYLKTYVGSC